MDEIELRVRTETNRLLKVRTGVVATVVLLGIIAGNTLDLLLGRLIEHPYRLLINVVGLTAMVSAVILSRSSRLTIPSRMLAVATSFAFCVFMLAMSVDAGPDAAKVVVVAYTVMNLGAATLLPWGVWNQLLLVGMVVVSIHASYYLLGEPVFLDPYVYVATFSGLGLSLFIAHSLERTRLLLARQRHELAKQKDLAEEQRLIAEEQRGMAEDQKEKAEALAQDLDAYAQAVAHDLKNPIQVIAGYTDLLEDKLRNELDDEAREYLRRTASGCGKMTQIIDSLLLLASVRKRKHIPTEPLDMAAVVAEARQRLSSMIRDSGARLREPEKWPTARGHAPWVEEIWANYISNAIKYGGDPPRLELGAESNGNGKVYFWVRDNGAGLKDDQVGRLFEEFTRLAETNTEGHGLGLSIVRRIVERLGGEVSVSSTAGEGSTFGFTLPR